MYFIVNNLTLDFYLQQLITDSHTRQQWIERLRDDFNERVDNNKLIKYLLTLSRGKISDIANNKETKLEILSEAVDSHEANEMMIRLGLLATILDSDMVNLEKFFKLRDTEPGLPQRFSQCYFSEDHLTLVFEEYEE